MEDQGKNKWVDEVLNSIDGMQRHEPNTFLFGKIETRLSQLVLKSRVISIRTISVAAACILLLVALNVVILDKANKSKTNYMHEVANDYGLTNNNPLYSL